MSGLPSGTVTMVFTDIEGSTALLTRLGSAYISALDGMRSTVRARWAAHGGVEMGTEGDSFFVVFESAPAAVAAATEAQRGLGGYHWPRGDPVRVRMGIHTGSPVVHDGGYVGLDVHRAARIASAAHGGQLVLSAATKELVERDLPAGTDLLDLGHHQLKDIGIPERIFQVAGPGLESGFPPLKSIGTSSNLPAAETGLVGRDGELAELAALMGASDIRLVTLTGPGGSGKTRLSIALADRLATAPTRFADGVYFVPLAEVTGLEGAWAKVADALDVPIALRAAPQVLNYLAQRQTLLVLDNLEQLSEADALVSSLIQGPQRLAVVATSRHPLHVRAEHEHPVPPLQLPETSDAQTVGRSGAIQMFVQYAQLVRPSFALTAANAADIAEICRRLDGLPLALELAAARCKILTPKALLARLGTALDIASPGNYAPARHRTLRDTIDWSYHLLTEEQQVFFRKLGVFAGRARIDSVAAVAMTAGADPLELVAELVDCNLIAISETADGEPRVAMLETIRSYARDKLTELAEMDGVRAAHAQHFAGVAGELADRWVTDTFVAGHIRFDEDVDNFREALAFTTQPADADDATERARLGLRIAIQLNSLWHDAVECQHWLELAVRNPAAVDSPELARAHSALASELHDAEASIAEATIGAEIATRIGSDEEHLAATQTIGRCLLMRGEVDAAGEQFLRCIEAAKAIDDNVRLGHLYDLMGFVADEQGDLVGSLRWHEQAYEIAVKINYSWGICTFTQNHACQLRLLGRPAEALTQLTSILRATVSTGHTDSMITLSEDLGCALVDLERPREAAVLFGAADAARLQFHRPADPPQARDVAEAIAVGCELLGADEWAGTFAAGEQTRLDVVLAAHVPD